MPSLPLDWGFMKGGSGLRREAQADWARLEWALMDLPLGHENVLKFLLLLLQVVTL